MDFASPKENGRLVSLDVFRGITILAMILVNNPGDWGNLWWPLGHAKWDGWTPTDLIFPFFLFIVGTSMAYSFRKYRTGTGVDAGVYWRILRRTVMLFGLGLLLNSSGKLMEGTFDFNTLRIMGVLQRIALVYFAASLLVILTGVRTQIIVAAVILLGYWVMLTHHPAAVPAAERLDDTHNIVRVTDLKVLGMNHMFTRSPTEPEGLLSTLPAIVNTLFGYWLGLLIQRHVGIGKPFVQLLIGGAVLFALGWWWGEYFPINKKIWTSSFVLLTSGLAMMSLAACLFVFDGLGLKRLARPFEIVGVNAIFVFVAASLTATFLRVSGYKPWLYSKLVTSWIDDPVAASHVYAVATVAFWWLILWLMSRKGWAIRV